MKLTNSTKRTYVSPEAKAVALDFQAVLAASGNPSITNPPMQWGTQKKDFPWEKTETQNESL